VIVTGGARGIGAETCEVLAEHGAHVVVNYSSSAEKANAVVDKLGAMGAKAIAIAADVRDDAAVQAMIAQTMAEFGRVDGLINNAIAGRQDGSFDSLSDEDFQNMFDFNCLAVARTTRAVRPIMRELGRRAHRQHRHRNLEHGSRRMGCVHGGQRRHGGYVPFLGRGAWAGEHHRQHDRARMDGHGR
jgi:NAD(P)-dependent dehydrogenase (short-subunit alcohol dehydrogenase family)